MLSDATAGRYAQRLTEVIETADVTVLGEECFGPASILVEYDTIDELVEVARHLPGQLTAAIHAEPDDHNAVRPSSPSLSTGSADSSGTAGLPAFP